jgi:hypothetical protein
MKIKVTQEHIDKGIRSDANKCPLALAICDEGTKPTVGLAYVYLWHEGTHTGKNVRLPHEALMFRRAFDARRPVEPFEFELELGLEAL